MNEAPAQFVKAEVYAKRYVQCPICKEATNGFHTDHLLEYAKPDNPYKVGPWSCERCKTGFYFQVHQNGEVDIMQDAEQKRARSNCFVLLRSSHEDSPIHLVLNTDLENATITQEKQQQGSSHISDWYTENTCPTNWVRNIQKFIFEGDDDPHGVFEFVRVLSHADAIEMAKSHPAEFDIHELNSAIEDPAAIAEYFEDSFRFLFPESVSSGVDIEGETINALLLK